MYGQNSIYRNILQVHSPIIFYLTGTKWVPLNFWTYKDHRNNWIVETSLNLWRSGKKENRGGESTPFHLSIIHSSSVYQVNYLHNKLNENKFLNISGHGDKKAVISRIIIFQIKFFFFQWQTRPNAGQLVQHRSNLIKPLSTWGSLNSRTLFLQYLMVPLSTWCSL